MNFQDRMKVCTAMLVEEGLQGFTPPRGMDPSEQEAVIRRIADAMNRKLPIGREDTFRDNLRRVFQTVFDRHDSYAWPTQAEFVAALPSIAPTESTRATDEQRDYDREAAKLINDGRSVQEAAIWGLQASRMIGARLVTRDQIESYRKGSVHSFIEIYRQDAQRMMEDRYGEAVRPYFWKASA
jgi:hypothetical protein